MTGGSPPRSIWPRATMQVLRAFTLLSSEIGKDLRPLTRGSAASTLATLIKGARHDGRTSGRTVAFHAVSKIDRRRAPRSGRVGLDRHPVADRAAPGGRDAVRRPAVGA